MNALITDFPFIQDATTLPTKECQAKFMQSKLNCHILSNFIKACSYFRYLVICVEASTDVLRPLDLVACSRVGTQTKKCILLAIVSAGAAVPHYMLMEWWKGEA